MRLDAAGSFGSRVARPLRWLRPRWVVVGFGVVVVVSACVGVLSALAATPVWAGASEVTLPAHATNPQATLGSVACASVGNCVAVGEYTDGSSDGQVMVAAESSGVWAPASEVMLPSHATNPDAHLSSVACVSAGNCVAVGYYDDASGDQQAMVVGESAGGWAASEVTLPTHATNPQAHLNSVACPSVGDCVAVGYYDDGSGDQQAMVVGESGNASEVTLPTHATNPQAVLSSVACPSAGNCVAVGYYDDGSGDQQAMVVGESAGAWGDASEVTLPTHATNPDAGLGSVACASVGNCVAVGSYSDGSGNQQATVVGESAGVWGPASEVTLPTHATNPIANLSSVACASVGNCVAVGNYRDGSSDFQALVVGESAGLWGAASEVTLPTYASAAFLFSLACASAGSCVAVGAEYDVGASIEQAMVVDSVASLAVSTSGLPAAVIGSAYSAQLAASGGAGNYTWSLSSGSLPAGLSLNAASGVILGTPTATGTASFTVSASDPGPPGQQASAALSITVAGPSLAKVETKGPKVTVTLTCGATTSQSCTGTLALTTLEHLRGRTITAITATKKPKQPKRTTRTIALAQTGFSVTGASSQTLTITLNTAGQRLLAKHHRLPAKLTLTPTGINTAIATTNLTITPSKPKPKHHH